MNQKLENILNLSLEVSEEDRRKSEQLGVGFQENTNTWELIVKYNGDIRRLQSDLISVEELIAGYAIVTIPENLIESFSELDEIEYVEKPKRLYFSTLQGREASCVIPVTVREPFLSGRGTIVAVIDSGIDYENPEFRDEQGNTRILALWDQTITPGQPDTGNPPEGFQTGVEFSMEKINQALSSNSPERIVPSRDLSGHGTSVAAIAAAGGRLQEGRYQGVAPGSQLLIVKLGSASPTSFPRTTELMRALTYVVRKGVELERPVAVNLSFGNTYGSHDGTSLLERFLDNAAEIGRTVICVGSGNEGAAAGHVSGSFGAVNTNRGQNTAGSSGTRRIELSVSDYQTAFSVQIWKEYVDVMEIHILSPNGTRILIQPDSPGGKSFVLENTELLVYAGEPAPYSISQETYIDFIPVSSYVNQGVWAIELVPIRTITGRYDLYLPSSAVLNAGTRFFTPTPEKTLTIPSTAGKIITVGAYQTGQDSYADFSGRGSSFSGAAAGTSSSAGVGKPDIVAPGVNIQTIGPNNTFVQVSGTSFATPFATGGAALLMEWGIIQGNDPFLYGEKVKAYFRRGARPIRGESEYPNSRVGWGALCVADSLPI